MWDFIGLFDALALGWFVVCFAGYWLATRRGILTGRSIMSETQRQRVLWMRCMLSRENRLVDAHIIAQLSNGHAFFASTSIIVLGGLAAAIASADDVKRIFEALPFVAVATLALWEIKFIVLMLLFVIAFFQFAWAYRLAHYTGIMIASAPYPPMDDEAVNARHARRLARLAGFSAEHANDGLRAFYFAIAGTTWFLHPLLFILATTGVTIVLYRREYRSRAFRTIARLSSMTAARE